MQTCLENTSLPLLESAPAWTIRVAGPADTDRNELARELRGVPKAVLRQVFGKLLGTRLWQQLRPATPAATTGSSATPVSATARISDRELSSGLLRYLCTEAAATLRERQRFAKSISLTVLYPNGESETAHQLLLRSTNDAEALEAAAHTAIRGMRSRAFASLKLDLTAAGTQA
jgi:nucleotidyltransferase/DNA polymerase involved in DNA repair